MKSGKSKPDFLKLLIHFFTHPLFLKIVRNFCRYAVGGLFIFSGFVKAIDPLGSSYKFTDYFEAWNATSLEGLSLPLAFLLSSGEMLIGLSLFFKLRMKEASWALLSFMVFFTFLTLYIALANPVTDCGCFGDAWILSNWGTFYKNLIIMVPTLIVFFQRKKFSPLFSVRTEWILVGVLFIAGIGLGAYCYRNLPILDFRPYQVGANIPSGMEFKQKVDFDEQNYVFVYEKNGQQKDFYLSNLPDMSEGWTFVERRDMVEDANLPEEPPIHDFGLMLDGKDYAQEILADTGYSVLIIAHKLENTNEKGLRKAAEFAREAIKKGYKAYGMSSTVGEEVEEVKQKLNLPFEFYASDDIMLKTVVRSNPGVVLIKEGTILAKWNYRDIPDKSFFEEQGMSRAITQIIERRDKVIIFLGILLVVFMALLIYSFTFVKRGKRNP